MIHFRWDASSEEYCCALHLKKETPSTNLKGDRRSEVEGRKRIVFCGPLSLGSVAINRAWSQEEENRDVSPSSNAFIEKVLQLSKKICFPSISYPHFSR